MTVEEREPLSLSEVPSWSGETDVLVVGAGAAGVCAAIGARERDAEVIVLEAAGDAGGTSAMSGGLLYLGGGTALQQACGFEDSPEEMAAFLMAACGPWADADKVERYSADSVAHFDWLVASGVPFKPEFWDAPTAEPWTDAGLMYSGGEDAEPFASIARPAPRGHCPASGSASRFGSAGGWLLMDVLAREATQAGATVSASTRVQRLITGSDGEVVGVHARSFGEHVYLRARRGVVLAAGGFVQSDDLLAAHAPALLGTNKLGVDENDGAVLTAAMAAGAAVQRMSAGEAAFSVPPALFKRGILVNRRGQRFINEDAYLGRIGQEGLLRQQGEVWLVFDEEAFDDAEEFRGPVQPDAVCETLDELAEECGFTGGALQNTVIRYNESARQGADPDFGKSSSWLRELRSPFAALDARGRFRTFTLGGLSTDADGRVAKVAGGTVPGLYAAGRIAAGLPATGYVSGASLGDCTYFGRRAGRAAGQGE